MSPATARRYAALPPDLTRYNVSTPPGIPHEPLMNTRSTPLRHLPMDMHSVDHTLQARFPFVDESARAWEVEVTEVPVVGSQRGRMAGRVITVRWNIIDKVNVRQLQPDTGDAEVNIHRDIVVLKIQHHHERVGGQAIRSRAPTDQALATSTVARQPRCDDKREAPIFGGVVARELETRIALAQLHQPAGPLEEAVLVEMIWPLHGDDVALAFDVELLAHIHHRLPERGHHREHAESAFALLGIGIVQRRVKLDLKKHTVLIVALAVVHSVVGVAGIDVFAEEEDRADAVGVVEVTVLKGAFAEQRFDFIMKGVAPLRIP